MHYNHIYSIYYLKKILNEYSTNMIEVHNGIEIYRKQLRIDTIPQDDSILFHSVSCNIIRDHHVTQDTHVLTSWTTDLDDDIDFINKNKIILMALSNNELLGKTVVKILKELMYNVYQDILNEYFPEYIEFILERERSIFNII